MILCSGGPTTLGETLTRQLTSTNKPKLTMWWLWRSLTTIHWPSFRQPIATWSCWTWRGLSSVFRRVWRWWGWARGRGKNRKNRKKRDRWRVGGIWRERWCTISSTLLRSMWKWRDKSGRFRIWLWNGKSNKKREAKKTSRKREKKR